MNHSHQAPATKSTTVPPAPPIPLRSSWNPIKGVQKVLERRKKHEVIKIDDSLEFRPKDLVPASIFDHIDWKRANGIVRSQGGSAGVFFVRLAGIQKGGEKGEGTYDSDADSKIEAKEDEVVVLKANSTIAQEVFGAELGTLLGVSTPRIRLLCWPSWEWELAQQCLRTVCEKNEVTLAAVNHFLNRPVISVMEFIRGKPIDAIGLGQPDRTVVVKHVLNAERLQTIGRIMVLDLLINNSDRIPNHLVWSELNDGNPDNLMVTASGIVGIDNRAMTILGIVDQGKPNPLYEKYMESVATLCRDITSKRENAACFLQCGEFLQKTTSYALSATDLKEVYMGWQAAVQKIDQSITRDTLLSVTHRLAGLVNEDWEDVWNDQVKLINIDFVWEVATLLRATARVTLNVNM